MSGIKLNHSAEDIAHMRKDWREASYFDAENELPGLLSDHDTLRTANQRLETEHESLLVEWGPVRLDLAAAKADNQRLEEEIKRLREALTLSRNLMLSKGFSESDPLGISAIDVSLSASNSEVTE